MNKFYRFLLIHFSFYFHINTYIYPKQDEIPVETTNNVDVKQSLDEISREVNDMKAQLTANSNAENSNNNNNNNNNEGTGDGEQRAIVGEIEKIKKIAEILETVVLPTIVDSQTSNGQKQNQNNHGSVTVNSGASDPIKILPKGLKLLQHHNAITSNIDDGQPVKAATQFDDN